MGFESGAYAIETRNKPLKRLTNFSSMLLLQQ